MDNFKTKLLKPFLIAVSFLCFLIVKENKRKKSAKKTEKEICKKRHDPKNNNT